MKEKMIKVSITAQEQAQLDMLRAGAKIVVAPEKKASFNDRLIAYLRDLAGKKDSGALMELQAIISGLASPADKWNYVAFVYQFIKAVSSDEFKALKPYCDSTVSAAGAFSQLKAIFDSKKDSKNISAESR